MIFDSHSDIWSDVTRKSLQGETDIFRRYHMERLKKGNVEGSIFVMWIDPPYDDDPAKRQAQIMDSVRKEMAASKDVLRIVHSYEEMMKAREEGIFYAFIGCEGLSSIGEDLSGIDEFYDFGARHASLTWNEENPLATGMRGNPDRGLTPLGIQAMKKIQDKHMILDVSHLNDASFWDVMKHAVGPVAATHSSSRALCPAGRNLTDDMAKALRETGGMVGINSYHEFTATDISNQTVDYLAKHMEHMVELMDIDHVGFGFDFFEFLEGDAVTSCSFQEETAEKLPTPAVKGMKDASEVPNLLKVLKKIGFTEKDIQKIARENWHRYIQEVIG